jgi:AcrR family transcriptional regulator
MEMPKDGDAGPKSPGRPRRFDLDRALDTAMLVFWQKGYDSTSVSDLTAALGITRPSLYAAFGNKESLFRKVLERYLAGPSAYFGAALMETTARQAIERWLVAAIELWTASENPPGCLIIRASVSVDSSHSIRQEIEAQLLANEVRLRERIERGVEEGEFPVDADRAGLARYFLTLWRGLAVGAVSGMKREELLAIAKMAARVWPRQPYSDIAKFLRRFPPARIEGTQGFVDFEKELIDRLGLPPVEQVVVEGPHGSLTFRDFDKDSVLRDSPVEMNGQFQIVPCEKFDLGRAIGFLKSLCSAEYPLEQFRQFWALAAPQGEAYLDRAIAQLGGREIFETRLRKLYSAAK